MEYTYCSTDPDHYNRIFCPINSVEGSNQVQWSVVSISGFCNLVALGVGDYITINGFKCEVQEDIMRVDSGYYVELNKLIEEKTGVKCKIDRTGRYYFMGQGEFTIHDASYRMKQCIGLYNETFPISCKNEFRCKSLGYEMLGPMLILLSNLGHATTLGDPKHPLNYKNVYIAAKFPNNMTPGQPLYASGSEGPITVQGSALSNIRLELVDFNFHPVQLLTPLYCTISVQPLPEDEGTAQALATLPPNKELQQTIKQVVEQKTVELIQKSNYVEAVNIDRRNEEGEPPLFYNKFTEQAGGAADMYEVASVA